MLFIQSWTRTLQFSVNKSVIENQFPGKDTVHSVWSLQGWEQNEWNTPSPELLHKSYCAWTEYMSSKSFCFTCFIDSLSNNHKTCIFSNYLRCLFIKCSNTFWDFYAQSFGYLRYLSVLSVQLQKITSHLVKKKNTHRWEQPLILRRRSAWTTTTS